MNPNGVSYRKLVIPAKQGADKRPITFYSAREIRGGEDGGHSRTAEGR